MITEEWKKENNFLTISNSCGCCKYCLYDYEERNFYCVKMCMETDSYVSGCTVELKNSCKLMEVIKECLK